ncbi:MAG: hypothetical protein NE334_14235 [Lentisphaeraceae bacterium]|nr:hypothetical protein [Lentisphaeraceae bacterium]
MKKFIASLFLVSVFTFVGCGEKTTGDKVDDAIEAGSDKAEDAKEAAGEALEGLKK